MQNATCKYAMVMLNLNPPNNLVCNGETTIVLSSFIQNSVLVWILESNSYNVLSEYRPVFATKY